MAKGKALEKAGETLNHYFTGVAEATEPTAEQMVRASSEDSKNEKKVFSFRAPTDEVTQWRTYAKAKGIKTDILGEKALQEYVKRHKLTDEEKEAYEIMYKAEKMKAERKNQK